MLNIPKTFWTDMEKPGFFKYVIYGDTDSMYINVPELKPTSKNHAVELANEIASNINNLITDYTNNYILKKLGVDQKNNRTSYKTELIAQSILLLDIKKYYAYKELCNKGIVLDNPKVVYLGVPVVRNDYSKIAQNFIKELIDNIALNEKIENSNIELRKLLDKTSTDLQKAITNLDIKYIGVPAKWKSSQYKEEPYFMIAMRFYNSITKTETFKEMSSCYTIPIVLRTPSQVSSYISKLESNKYYLDRNIDINKITYLAFPYTFDKLKILRLMNEYNISIEFDQLWDKINSKASQRIQNVIINEG